ncbi:MAG: helix-turn-helix domain-containing protein [Actinomycetota bacterium]
MTVDAERVIAALRPALEANGSAVIAPQEAERLDVPIEWDGEIVAYARIGSVADALGNLVHRIEKELGAPLPDLDRTGKQVAVRLLDERGAFLLRRSIEDIAEVMGVSRITIYNYLNAIRS